MRYCATCANNWAILETLCKSVLLRTLAFAFSFLCDILHFSKTPPLCRCLQQRLFVLAPFNLDTVQVHKRHNFSFKDSVTYYQNKRLCTLGNNSILLWWSKRSHVKLSSKSTVYKSVLIYLFRNRLTNFSILQDNLFNSFSVESDMALGDMQSSWTSIQREHLGPLYYFAMLPMADQKTILVDGGGVKDTSVSRPKYALYNLTSQDWITDLFQGHPSV